MSLILGVITLLYVALIARFCYAFRKVEPFLYDHSVKPHTTTFSIIIPFRNEAHNLHDLLNSLNAIAYPSALFEILFIDDASTDSSVAIINEFMDSSELNCRLMTNDPMSTSPKKSAITKAIQYAKHEWIITTDADCEVPSKWLSTFDAYISIHQPRMLVGPVTYHRPHSFFEACQLLDFLSLQSITMAAFGLHRPFLCNGANLAYERSLFLEVEGFNGNTRIASGDDIFLLEKVIQYDASSISYLNSKNSIVRTKPQSSLKMLLEQRIRWASKTTSYNQPIGKLCGMLVLLMNMAMVSGIVVSLAGTLPVKYLLLAFILKLIVDFWCIYNSAHRFEQKDVLSNVILCSLLHPFFTVYVAIASFFIGYKWKQRTYSI